MKLYVKLEVLDITHSNLNAREIFVTGKANDPDQRLEARMKIPKEDNAELPLTKFQFPQIVRRILTSKISEAELDSKAEKDPELADFLGKAMDPNLPM